MACGRSYDLFGDLSDCDKVLLTECNFISSLLRALRNKNDTSIHAGNIDHLSSSFLCDLSRAVSSSRLSMCILSCL